MCGGNVVLWELMRLVSATNLRARSTPVKAWVNERDVVAEKLFVPLRVGGLTESPEQGRDGSRCRALLRDGWLGQRRSTDPSQASGSWQLGWLAYSWPMMGL